MNSVIQTLGLEPPQSAAQEKLLAIRAEADRLSAELTAWRKGIKDPNQPDPEIAEIDRRLEDIQHAVGFRSFRYLEPEQIRELCQQGEALAVKRENIVKERTELQGELQAKIAKAEPELDHLRDQLEYAEYCVEPERFWTHCSDFIVAVPAVTTSLIAMLQERERLLTRYSDHRTTSAGRFAPGCETPAVPRNAVMQIFDLMRTLCNHLAEARPDAFPGDHPARQRAEYLQRVDLDRELQSQAAQKRMIAATHKPATPAPPPPRDIWQVVAENDAAVAARPGGAK